MNSKLDVMIKKGLNNEGLDPQEAASILEWPEHDILNLVQAAYSVRYKYFKNKVKMHHLMNIQSGMCAEDCSYCSQSKSSHADIESYRMLQPHYILPQAKKAVDNGAAKLCLVASMRGPSQKDLDTLTESIRQVKHHYPQLEICASLGLLQEGQARQLKQAGVSTYNHNLNTSEDLYGEICTTHSFQDRVNTVQQAQSEGMLTCSGAIFGMGETNKDIIDVVFHLRKLGASSIPVNFLIPIEGTELEHFQDLTPQRCLKILTLFRLHNPDAEIRAAAGREIHLRSMQPLALYVANSLFLGDYLTTKGQSISQDLDMIRDFGFEVEGMSEDIPDKNIADSVELLHCEKGCGENCDC